MSTLTTTATYQKGIIIPKIIPPYSPSEVLVIFMEPQVALKSKTEKVLKIVKDTFGAWGEGTSGIKYENKIRADAEKHFQNI